MNKVFSPYKAVQFINENKLTTREVVPQQLYADIRAGKVEFSINETGHKVVTRQAVDSWIEKINEVFAKKAAKAASSAETEDEESK